jgi:ferredoxin-NADP reductase
VAEAGTEAGPPPGRPVAASPWAIAEVTRAMALTPGMRSIILRPERWPGHRAGQHIQLRLTAPDGYSAQRDYSIAGADDGSGLIEIAVDRLPDGEVSPFLHDELAVGDRIELRGPIGGHFVWEPKDGGPLLLVAGGSGIVPLMAMLRARARASVRAPAALVFAARRFDDLAFRDELLALSAADPGLWLRFALSRDSADHPAVHAGRLDRALLGAAAAALGQRPAHVFVCGSNRFVEAAVDGMLAIGIAPGRIRTERFGGA